LNGVLNSAVFAEIGLGNESGKGGRVELERQVLTVTFYLESIHADDGN
jgi:hypothetical protein